MKSFVNKSVINLPRLSRRYNNDRLGNAWLGVSAAFAKTGRNMYKAINVINCETPSPPGTVRVFAEDAMVASLLENVSFLYTSNRKIRVIAKKKTAALLRNVSFTRLPNGDICVVSNKDEN